jgi:eukaryotic-like serine/threonine-protein kinase
MKFCAACNKTFPDAESFCPVDGEVLQESPESFVGRVLDGKYKVEGFIAQGGMGAVYRARHILLGDQVVIKTLRSEMRGNSEWLKRFQREGQAARAFRHPNSVTVYDLSAGSDGMIYMVMEYVEGHTLDTELKRRGRFTPAAALEVLEPVADVLDAAHARGVVHRDLKPENIMLGHEDRGHTVIKVLDLGIAKMVGAGDVHAASATSLTVAGQILGTPYYMSPEQWGEMPRDGNPEVDGRTDIYSLGVIFFELVAGRKPLGGRTLSELRQKHVSETLPALGSLVPGVPEGFSRGVAHAMAKDRADRPQTAGELVEELRASLGLEPRARRSQMLATDAGVTDPTGAVSARGTSATPHDASESATAFLPAGTNAEHLDRSHADTVLTSELESPFATAPGRETSAQPARPDTSGGVGGRRGGGSETYAARVAATQTDADAGSVQQQSAGETRGAVAETRAASEGGAANQGGHVVTAPVARRSLAPLVVGGVLALLLVAGVVGFFAWRSMNRRAPVAGDGAAAQPPADLAHPSSPAASPKAEAASFWFEAFDKPEDAAGKRVAEPAATLVSGQRFRFHFMPKERGYLYIIGPGAGGNAQITLLTAQGAGALKTNLVGAGADFSFPSVNGSKLKLDETPGTDEFTFIFSPTPLLSPSFLAGKYLHELSPAEVKELEDFRAQFRADAPAVAVAGDGDERRVAISTPQSATDAGKPVIFDVRINHR